MIAEQWAAPGGLPMFCQDMRFTYGENGKIFPQPVFRFLPTFFPGLQAFIRSKDAHASALTLHHSSAVLQEVCSTPLQES